jgi:hypothetical protein
MLGVGAAALEHLLEHLLCCSLCPLLIAQSKFNQAAAAAAAAGGVSITHPSVDSVGGHLLASSASSYVVVLCLHDMPGRAPRLRQHDDSRSNIMFAQ